LKREPIYMDRAPEMQSLHALMSAILKRSNVKVLSQ
jgi:hypothetical protein